MLYPAHWLIFAFVVLAVLFWLGLLIWAGRLGLFKKSSESLRYRVFDDDDDDQHRSGTGANQPPGDHA